MGGGGGRVFEGFGVVEFGGSWGFRALGFYGHPSHCLAAGQRFWEALDASSPHGG